MVQSATWYVLLKVSPTCSISFVDQSKPPLGTVLRAHNAYTFSSQDIVDCGTKEQDGGRRREGGAKRAWMLSSYRHDHE